MTLRVVLVRLDDRADGAIRAALAGTPHRITTHSDDGAAGAADGDVFMTFEHHSDRPMVPPGDVVAAGGYAVALVGPTATGGATLAAIEQGYSFTLAATAGPDRIRSLTDYLWEVGPPPSSASIEVSGSEMRYADRAAELPAATLEVLRVLAANRWGIVSNETLAERVDDHVRAAARLKRALADLGSRAQVLKVPQIGYRLVGTLVDHDAPDAGAPDPGGAERPVAITVGPTQGRRPNRPADDAEHTEDRR